jgi:hypothetical protein
MKREIKFFLIQKSEGNKKCDGMFSNIVVGAGAELEEDQRIIKKTNENL